MKTAWCGLIADKFGYYERIPYKVVGAFGMYCGYTKQQAKECIADCFDEFAGIADQRLIHTVAGRLLNLESVASQQLRHFADNEESDLHWYPEAFLEIQDRRALAEHRSDQAWF